MVLGVSIMRVEARDAVAGFFRVLEERRVLVAFSGDHARAAWMKRAARGRIDGRGEIALEQDAKSLLVRIGDGRGGEQCPRIRVARIFVEHRGGRLLDDSPE